jgi:hypothetical protein
LLQTKNLPLNSFNKKKKKININKKKKKIKINKLKQKTIIFNKIISSKKKKKKCLWVKYKKKYNQ